MSRFIDFWEGYEFATTDYINEFHGGEDTILKGKFNLLNKALKFSGKVKFSSEGGASSATGDYSLTHKPWKDSSYMFSHKAKNGETKLDGHFWLAEHRNLNFQVYVKNQITQDSNGKSSDTTLQIRTIHPNFIFSVGMENFNFFHLIHTHEKTDLNKDSVKKQESTNILPNLSFWSLGGAQVDKELALWGGLGLSFNLNKTNIDSAKILGTGFHSGRNVKGTLEGIFNRVDKDDKSSVWVPSARAFFDVQAIKNYRVLGSVEYLPCKKNVRWSLANEFKLDSSTALKTRVNQDFTLSTALIHSFGSFARFALNANINYVPSSGEKHAHLSYKFGSSLEFLDV